MGRRPAMPRDERRHMVGMLDAGMSVTEVAYRFGVHPSTVSRLKTRYQATGYVSDRPRSGRPKKTSQRKGRFIVVTSRRNRFMSAPKIARQLRNATGVRISGQTVRNRLRSVGLKGMRPVVSVPLTQRHRRLRVQWATLHQRWIQRHWNEVLFTDESRFNVEFADGRARVWRRRGEWYDPQNVIQRDCYGGGSVMVWGGVSYRGKTQLIIVNGRLNSQRY